MEPSYKFLAITRGTNERSVRGSQKGSTPKKTPYRICLVVLGVVSVPVHHPPSKEGGFFVRIRTIQRPLAPAPPCQAKLVHILRITLVEKGLVLFVTF